MRYCINFFLGYVGITNISYWVSFQVPVGWPEAILLCAGFGKLNKIVIIWNTSLAAKYFKFIVFPSLTFKSMNDIFLMGHNVHVVWDYWHYCGCSDEINNISFIWCTSSNRWFKIQARNGLHRCPLYSFESCIQVWKLYFSFFFVILSKSLFIF
jgi:hypothetical protein